MNQINHLKIYILLLAMVHLNACKQEEKKVTENKKEDNNFDYRSKGFVSLKNSSVLKDILCQAWEYKEDVAETKNLDVTSNLEVLYRGYCFFEDGKAIKDPRGNMSVAKWHVDEKEKPVRISLQFEDGKKETNHLAYLVPYEMILVNVGNNEKKTNTLTAAGRRHINITDDPFYVTNMLWRIKPVAPETDRQIKQRLLSSVHFFVLFYDEQINAAVKRVTFIGLPSCFNWHSGGIFLPKKTDLQAKWINCFYNQEQAMKAYYMAEKLLSQKYQWPKKGNWLELNVAVLKQMESRLMNSL